MADAKPVSESFRTRSNNQREQLGNLCTSHERPEGNIRTAPHPPFGHLLPQGALHIKSAGERRLPGGWPGGIVPPLCGPSLPAAGCRRASRQDAGAPRVSRLYVQSPLWEKVPEGRMRGGTYLSLVMLMTC